MRRGDFGTLYCPEFTLRYLPRITVRGQTVPGGGVPLRNAPLPSRICPWSTRRPCGPLAFRRATEGSRVQRKMRGSQEGDKKPFGVLSPSCPRRRAAALLSAVGTALPSPPGGGNPANHLSGSSRAQIPRVFFIFSGLQLTFSIFHGILNYRK